MMAKHQKMQTGMKAMHEELDRLVTAMNRAPEGKKMVEQSKAMREAMMSMQTKELLHRAEQNLPHRAT